MNRQLLRCAGFDFKPCRDVYIGYVKRDVSLITFLHYHKQPKQRCKQQRKQFKLKSRRQHFSDIHCAHLESTILRRIFRNATGSRLLVIFPPETNEIEPVSSDTTITSASTSSVRPMAALCLVPSSLATSGLCVRGRKQPACVSLPCWIITAPSCMGE